jgi:hypothetical protein
MLTVLILVFGPLSGAHFNRRSASLWAIGGNCRGRRSGLHRGAGWRRRNRRVDRNLMFELPVWQLSFTQRTGPDHGSPSLVATFGLLLTIFGCAARTPTALPYAGRAITSPRLLVHRIDVICQSGGDCGAGVVRHPLPASRLRRRPPLSCAQVAGGMLLATAFGPDGFGGPPSRPNRLVFDGNGHPWRVFAPHINRKSKRGATAVWRAVC